ncbi:MAG: glycosyltransferase family 4 protein [Gluconacetobacter diazotrophicus]|nr:glycosyltransferase family 4 protein [Gluconacetobacter diazotrophicus]
MEFGLLTWGWPPEPSGLAVAAREIALSAAARGARVRVFTLDRPFGTVAVEDDVEILGCAPGPILRRLRRFAVVGHLAAPLAAWRAVRASHRRRPLDVLEATNWYAPGVLVSRFGPVPLGTRHSTPAGTGAVPPSTLRDRVDLRFARFLERWSARGGAANISNTAPHAAWMSALYGVPPPGPDHPVLGLSLPPVLLDHAARAPYPDHAVPVELLFIGRNEPRKGTDALLAAIALLAGEAESGCSPPFRLHAVGLADHDLLALSPAARSRIIPLSRLSEPEKHALLERAHAVLAPSRYESFGLVYQEALAFGRPLLACAEDPSASASFGPNGTDPGAALLAARCEPDCLATAIRRLLCEPGLRAELRTRALRAARRFDRATLGRGTLAAYAAFAVRPRAGSPAASAATGRGPSAKGADSAASS